MVYCQAFGCRNKSGKNNHGKSFHNFPNPEKRAEDFKKWAAAVKVEKFLKKSYVWDQHDVICSDHFVETDFQEDIRAKIMKTKPRNMLKKEAVPSIFSHKPLLPPSSREKRSIQAEKKEYLRSVLVGSATSHQDPSTSKGSSCPSTSTWPSTFPPQNPSVPMEGVNESGIEVLHLESEDTHIQSPVSMEGIQKSGVESSHLETSLTHLEEPVAEPPRKKRRARSKRKRATSKKCCKLHALTMTANASTQTLSSGLRLMAEKTTQCPEDFSYIRKDHTYATSMLTLLQPSFVMAELPEEPSTTESGVSEEESFAESQALEGESVASLAESQAFQGEHVASLAQSQAFEGEHVASLAESHALEGESLESFSESQALEGQSFELEGEPRAMVSVTSDQSSSGMSPAYLSSSSSSSSPISASDDPSYTISDVSSSSSDDEPGEPDEIEYCKEKKFIVFENCIDQLLYGQPCTACTDGHIAELKKTYIGTMMSVKVVCVCGNVAKTWHSQPTIGKQPVGNLLTCASTIFGGKTYEDMKVVTDLINVQFMSDTTFYEIQDAIVLPLIHTFYINTIEETRNQHRQRALTICGDGRCDSPGYNAKYSTYTCISMDTNKILGMSLVSVKEATSSVAMEKVGFERTLNDLLEDDLDISVVATDRHTGIRKTLKDNYADIDHQFDVWHLTKSLTKRLTAKAKTKECQDLLPWIKAITNHVWWSTQHCGGDEVMLIEMIQSMTHHICNIHQWNSADKFHECRHGLLTDDEASRRKWIVPGSKSHEALQGVLFDRRLVTDMKRLTKACHTGAIEVYHSLYLKYCPKRKHFFYKSMLGRAELAVLDHNANTGRKQAVVKRARRGTAAKGEFRYRYVWSKTTRDWIQKKIPEDKNYEYLWDMLVAVLQAKAGDFELEAPVYPVQPKNIAPVPRPSREELKDRASSRFAKQQQS